MVKGLINKIIPFSSVDGPGNRTAIFFQGCNFNCIYCHNPETINHCISCNSCTSCCPSGSLVPSKGKLTWNESTCTDCGLCIKNCSYNSSPKIREMSVSQIMLEITNYRPFISGITTSGGECTLQAEFITSLFWETRKSGLTCFVDSNGSQSFKDVPELLDALDMVMLDLKSFDKSEHKSLTGKDNDLVLSNIEYLAKTKKLYEVRTVIVPGLLNNEYTVKNTARLLASLNPAIKYKLIKYRPFGVRSGLGDISVPTDEYMNNLAVLAKAQNCTDVVII